MDRLGADQYSIHLGGVAADSKRAEVVFDYGIQHLPQWISGSGASLGLHISAIQAAAIMGRTVHLPAIRNLATNAAANPSLRLTSIAALGLYGAEDSRVLLESIGREDGKFSYAAKSAINRLDQNLAASAK